MRKIKEKVFSITENGKEVVSIHEDKIEVTWREVLIGIGIVIILFFVSLAIAQAAAQSAEMTVGWTMPTTNEDGTVLTDLAGIKVYWGTSSSNYTDNVDVGMSLLHTITNLTEDTTYYISVTAYDTSGNESDFSEEVSNEELKQPVNLKNLQVVKREE